MTVALRSRIYDEGSSTSREWTREWTREWRQEPQCAALRRTAPHFASTAPPVGAIARPTCGLTSLR